MSDSGSSDEVENDIEPQEVPADGATDSTRRQRVGAFLRSRPGIVVLVVVGILVIVGVVLAVPASRYAVAGLVVKRDARVAIVDSSTRAPLSGVRVDAEGIVATTNAKGIATLRSLPAGPHRFSVAKKYYRSASGTLMVPILGASGTSTQRLVATGFPLQVTATDRITGGVLVGAKIEIGASVGTTDDKGLASIVLPVSPSAQTGTVTRDGYNAQQVSVDVSEKPAGLAVALTSSGSLRYLSKATGVINVMEANLDGSDAKVVLAGTGSESDDSTTLLTTTDWKYSALLADRTGKRDALYVIPAGGKDPVTLDATASYLTLIGWQDHLFFWEAGPIEGSGPTTLQAYNADTGKKTVIDTTKTDPNAFNYFSSPYLQHRNLVYARVWSGSLVPSGVTSDLVDVDTGSLASKTVKSWPGGTELSLTAYQADRVYVRASSGSSSSFFSYSYSALTPATINDDRFGSVFPTYLESPSDHATLWAEQRDGKNTIFVGNEDGGDAKQLATLSEYTPYGWYGADDRYILLTKNSSELYIAPAGVPLTATNVLKVTDYHKPANTYPGYGSGYGG